MPASSHRPAGCRRGCCLRSTRAQRHDWCFLSVGGFRWCCIPGVLCSAKRRRHHGQQQGAQQGQRGLAGRPRPKPANPVPLPLHVILAAPRPCPRLQWAPRGNPGRCAAPSSAPLRAWPLSPHPVLHCVVPVPVLLLLHRWWLWVVPQAAPRRSAAWPWPAVQKPVLHDRAFRGQHWGRRRQWRRPGGGGEAGGSALPVLHLAAVLPQDAQDAQSAGGCDPRGLLRPRDVAQGPCTPAAQPSHLALLAPAYSCRGPRGRGGPWD